MSTSNIFCSSFCLTCLLTEVSNCQQSHFNRNSLQDDPGALIKWQLYLACLAISVLVFVMSSQGAMATFVSRVPVN